MLEGCSVICKELLCHWWTDQRVDAKPAAGRSPEMDDLLPFAILICHRRSSLNGEMTGVATEVLSK